MSDLRDLYQELILDHGKSPRNRRMLPGADREAKGHNPLCGDRITIRLATRDGRIRDAAFEGMGCAISTASASLMTESVRGRTLPEALALFEAFHALVTGAPAPAGAPDLGKLAVFSGVSEFPVRVKCASLAWHVLVSAIKGEGETVSTE